MTCKCERKSESNWTDCRNEAKSSTLGVLRARLLRLLGMNRDFERPLSIQGEIGNVGFTTTAVTTRKSILRYSKQNARKPRH